MTRRIALKVATAALIAGAVFAPVAQAAEVAIGEAVQKNGMDIGAVYLQAVKMEPMLPGMAATDIHLEADIHAAKGNENGFGPGDWVPYLGITYRLEKEGSGWSDIGTLMPMVANDGPHYGKNVKLDGPGKYKLTYAITPPIYQGFGRHTDEETGVAAWWSPFELSWEFLFAGTGKKGSY